MWDTSLENIGQGSPGAFKTIAFVFDYRPQLEGRTLLLKTQHRNQTGVARNLSLYYLDFIMKSCLQDTGVHAIN